MRTRHALVLLFLVMTFAACADSSSSTSTQGSSQVTESSSASRFLSRYVTSDGRVIRYDQGGDIVSEGQAYGMLIAEIAGRTALARTNWGWTQAHLLQADGLFAWHATGGGKVEDPQSATDADVLIAYSLLRYQGPDEEALHASGRRVALAVLSKESVLLPNGSWLPVAGPWATATSPPTVNPSYLMPGVFDAIATMTSDPRWKAAANAAVSLITELTHNGSQLPPDWAQIRGSTLVPVGQPGGGAPVQYSLDAARLPIWFATACNVSARELAASWWLHLLSSGERPASLALTLSGGTIEATRSPLTYIAGAAGATAAGDSRAAQRLINQADSLASSVPTYYGDAWVALGDALLGKQLDPCKEANDG